MMDNSARQAMLAGDSDKPKILSDHWRAQAKEEKEEAIEKTK